ncbi:DUF6531 domain-containing protein [Jeongeupia naejangsanensis]|uniref:RHS repeat protein n=1 Tax=Jeongeupia naejangsanensis TaxID=613195 RepID=A0ABS2BLB0_9NEIS|nr:DUF6531 domain-containing protein [Jeongeupia naejangsanensis]MBM3116400.1 RHS repeat protein [Jeongeupia naejangsanensis]
MVATRSYPDGTFDYDFNNLQCSGSQIVTWLNTSASGLTPEAALQQNAQLNMSRIVRNQCGSHIVVLHNNFKGSLNDGSPVGSIVFSTANYPLNRTYYDLFKNRLSDGAGAIIPCAVPKPPCPGGLDGADGASCEPAPQDKADFCPVPSSAPGLGQPSGILELCGNPISIGQGSKVQSEVDLTIPGSPALTLVRRYSSVSPFTNIVATLRGLGNRWTHNFDRSVTLTSNQTLSVAVRGDGRILHFKPKAGSTTLWVGDADVTDGLEKTTDGWRYTDPQKVVEVYGAKGKIVSRTFPNGYALSYSYDSDDRLSKVTDSFNRSLTFAYNSKKLLASVADSAGRTVSYEYTTDGTLTKVNYPDQTSRVYNYTDKMIGPSKIPALLTELIDESGTTYAKWSYDDKAMAISSEHAGITDKYAVGYQTTQVGSVYQVNTANVTNPLGAVSQISLQTVQGRQRPTSELRQTDNLTRTQSFDANGNLGSITDFGGRNATFSYDTTRNLETGRTEAAGTPQARTISTEWHASFRLPTKVTEPGRVTTFEYDASGNLLKKSVTADGATRVSSWTYGNYGLVASATDPAGKVTQYGYDAQGNLSTLTNPLGQITRFPRYDALGNVLEMVEANGQTTTFSYDLRQRLLSRTTAGETTSFSYLPTGLLSQVRFADNRTVSYRYDPAHRLIGIDDSRGNRIDYTLDAMGNRLREDRQDPAGTLAASLQQVAAQQSAPNQIAKP